ncbi:MAG: glycine--tRNA ligase subunit beta [Planctomycetes bacterium]|nr:glycine--tRNA ligase subunit beta [Planctomycetota bacterium]
MKLRPTILGCNSLRSNSPSIKINISGVSSGSKTLGHTFLSPKEITIKSADFTKYKAALKKAKVIVDQNERRQVIENALNEYHINEPELLEEVTNLVEWPVILECGFDESYLKLPTPVIESAMKSHQRYFPVKDKDGKLQNRFIVVANMPATKEIKEGNERVIRARLSDALFFWEQDRKTPLLEYAKRLDTIAFLGKLGTMAEKTKRLEELAVFIAEVCNYKNAVNTIRQAARLCKADLLTGMVGEFPDLQGIMGYEYLKNSEPDTAIAIKEHYQPRFAGDTLPQTPAGICLSLAEKFDNLIAAFAIDLKPTGSSDPYGLRRQGRAIVDIILNHGLRNLSLKPIHNQAIKLLLPNLPSGQTFGYYITVFVSERLTQIYLEAGYPKELIDAVLDTGLENIYQSKLRIETLSKLSRDPLWDELLEVVERTYNIGKGVKIEGEVNEALLTAPEEKELWNAYKQNKDKIQDLINKEQYEEASRMYHQVFARPAHIFFEKVFVNVPEQDIRQNRILLNQKINRLYSEQIADLSRIPRVTTCNKAT